MEEPAAKLSCSGRISLTDIVKSTIFNDEELPQSPKQVSYTYEDISDSEEETRIQEIPNTYNKDITDNDPETRTPEIPNNGLIFTNPLKDFAWNNESCEIKPHGCKRTHSESDIDNTCVYQSKKLCKEILNHPQQNLSAESLTFPSWKDIVNQSTHEAYGKFSSYDIAEQSSTTVPKENDVYFSSNSSINCSPAVDSRPNDALSLLCSSPVAQNPLFADLYAVLVVDCNMGTFPHTLLSVLNIEKREEEVFTREQNLQHQFNNLKDKCPVEIQQLSNFYQHESALINNERFCSLHEKQFPISCKDYLVAHYDIEHHRLIDRVEKRMTLLTQTENDVINNRTTHHFKPRLLLPKHAIEIMEEWYTQNSEHPYPTPIQAANLAQNGNIGIEQVKKWMANKRNRTRNTRTLTEIAMHNRQLPTEDASTFEVTQNSF